MIQPSSSHLVLIPTYNTGPKLAGVVEEALRHWKPVWVVVDGSTDGSDLALDAIASREPHLRIIRRTANGGKGAAVLTGTEAALAAGFTHVLTMDADGQHPADRIADFMAASQADPAAMVLGIPIFDSNVPLERLHGRKISVGLAAFETLGTAVADPLFGFRIYPAAPLVQVLRASSGARRYDFDPECAVRLFWNGVPAINIPAAVRYFSKKEGGISHFNYLRDNCRLAWMHTRLISQLLFWRWPAVRRTQKLQKNRSMQGIRRPA